MFALDCVVVVSFSHDVITHTSDSQNPVYSCVYEYVVWSNGLCFQNSRNGKYYRWSNVPFLIFQYCEPLENPGDLHTYSSITISHSKESVYTDGSLHVFICLIFSLLVKRVHTHPNTISVYTPFVRIVSLVLEAPYSSRRPIKFRTIDVLGPVGFTSLNRFN